MLICITDILSVLLLCAYFCVLLQKFVSDDAFLAKQTITFNGNRWQHCTVMNWLILFLLITCWTACVYSGCNDSTMCGV